MGSERTEKRRLGVVLSGGGARGFAHVGALRALNHIGIYPDFIVGVSMGAAVGATYALNDDWYDTLINMDISGFPPLPDFSTPGMMNYVKNLRVAQKAITGMYFGWGVGQPTADWGRAVLSDLTLNKPLEAGRIPIFATATDIVSGERVTFGSGPATDALYASAALAGILPPAEIDGRILVDGGYCDLAPVDVVRDAGADLVIVIDAATNLVQQRPSNGVQAMIRALEICQNEHTQLRFKSADLVIRPVIDPPVGVLEFRHKRRCAAAGTRAILQSRSALTALVRHSNLEIDRLSDQRP
ncbi:patatin-like phospholipase family protein [Sulfitobacter sp. CW3]|uniref:patatin-like phospholipase family protein n=1 Tax=Sulfitobacter sp. CW3 TaxID=2861965 RepID=UPI001C5E504B|nr:patatin-like phospholipase family protein [Sulfitobacter sp. CW3]MBW4963846.1 patatin-like phospholipase family protein [Sulfitobacter sp. CW3]